MLYGDPSMPAGLRAALQSVSHGFADAPDLARATTAIARLIARARGEHRTSPPNLPRSDPPADRPDPER